MQNVFERSLHSQRPCDRRSLVPTMKHALRYLLSLLLALAPLFLSGCQSSGAAQGIQQARLSAASSIQSEAPGDYFIGRRYFKRNFKFWGYVRQPGQPWSTSKLVMLNEKQKLAPDRAQNSFGSDNDFEYKLYGDFSGETVYEPASNGFYPEFILRNYEVVSTAPAPIFKSQTGGRAQAAAGALSIEKPE